MASYIKYSHDQPQSNTRTDRTHIRDSEHLAKLPKYRISLLTCVLPIGSYFSLMSPHSNLAQLKFNATNHNVIQPISIISVAVHGGLFWFFFLGTFILRWSLGEASLLGEEKRAREKPLAQWERIQADYLLNQVWGRTKEEKNAKALFLPHRALF